MGKRQGDEDDGRHRSASGSRRFPADQALRQAGWKIYARPGRLEAEWERGGLIFGQREALLLSGLAGMGN